MEDCIFCRIWKNKEREIIAENETFFAFFDDNPISKGHTLIIPKRHAEDFVEELNDEEKVQWQALLYEVKQILDKKYHPDGYKTVVNDGELKTVDHTHVHLIPYYKNGSTLSLRN